MDTGFYFKKDHGKETLCVVEVATIVEGGYGVREIGSEVGSSAVLYAKSLRKMSDQELIRCYQDYQQRIVTLNSLSYKDNEEIREALGEIEKLIVSLEKEAKKLNKFSLLPVSKPNLNATA